MFELVLLEKKVIIIVGFNGVGKIIFVEEFLFQEVQCLIFINVDFIVVGLVFFELEQVVF